MAFGGLGCGRLLTLAALPGTGRGPGGRGERSVLALRMDRAALRARGRGWGVHFTVRGLGGITPCITPAKIALGLAI